jgi:hypothetical protein
MPMLTPIVRELSRAIEPVAADTFLDEFTDRDAPRHGLPANVIRLSAHRTRRRQPAAAPTRAA